MSRCRFNENPFDWRHVRIDELLQPRARCREGERREYIPVGIDQRRETLNVQCVERRAYVHRSCVIPGPDEVPAGIPRHLECVLRVCQGPRFGPCANRGALLGRWNGIVDFRFGPTHMDVLNDGESGGAAGWRYRAIPLPHNEVGENGLSGGGSIVAL